MGKHANLEGSNLHNQQKEKVQDILMRHQQVFSRNSNDLGYCVKIKHQINSTKMHSHSEEVIAVWVLIKRKTMKKIVEDLEDAKLIEPTHSYWAAPSILVKKKHCSYRLVLDYRGLNKQTSWPLQRINDAIDSLDGNCYFEYRFDIGIFSNGAGGRVAEHDSFCFSNGTLQLVETTHGFGVSARSSPKFNGIDHGGTLLWSGSSIPG